MCDVSDECREQSSSDRQLVDDVIFYWSPQGNSLCLRSEVRISYTAAPLEPAGIQWLSQGHSSRADARRHWRFELRFTSGRVFSLVALPPGCLKQMFDFIAQLFWKCSYPLWPHISMYVQLTTTKVHERPKRCCDSVRWVSVSMLKCNQISLMTFREIAYYQHSCRHIADWATTKGEVRCPPALTFWPQWSLKWLWSGEFKPNPFKAPVSSEKNNTTVCCIALGLWPAAD